MAFIKSRFTLMCFPQGVDKAGKLTLNILFLPRNISPLEKVTTEFAIGGELPEAFVKVKPAFEIKIVNNPNEFAGKIPGSAKTVPPTEPFDYPADIEKIYTTLKNKKDENGNPKYFDIEESRSAVSNPEHRAGKPVEKATALRKYLPESYRNSFNFTAPKVPNAVLKKL